MRSNRKQQKNKPNSGKKKVIKVLIPLLCLFIGIGVYIFAKYYSHNYKSGVAVASGVYFTANYAVETEAEDNYYECIVGSGYQGKDYSFDFEVRNYENNMLFNDSSVVIPYSVYFWLGESVDDATYTVEYNGEQIELSAGKENKAGFSLQSIPGGRALANEYKISIDVTNDSDSATAHTPAPIYVEVKTEQGAVIDSVLRGKMVLSSKGRSESYIEFAGFVVSEDVEDDTQLYKEIQKVSELTYEIRTVGEVISGEEATEQLKVSWDPKVLEIDLYDELYNEWLEESQNDKPDTETNGWYYITIQAMPYSSNRVYFFRGEEFDNSVTDMESLNSFIKVEKYQDSEVNTQ